MVQKQLMSYFKALISEKQKNEKFVIIYTWIGMNFKNFSYHSYGFV